MAKPNDATLTPSALICPPFLDLICTAFLNEMPQAENLWTPHGRLLFVSHISLSDELTFVVFQTLTLPNAATESVETSYPI